MNRTAKTRSTIPAAAVVTAVVLGAAHVSRAAEPVDFVREVRPIFEKHCYVCHGERAQKSGLRLDVREAAFRGGDGYGASIVPGDAQRSPLIRLVTGDADGERMPPEGPAPSPAEVAVLVRWVNEGAPWPAGVDRVKLEDKRDHWSFRPLTDPAAPTPHRAGWARDDLDRFVLARLEAEGLQPSPEADRIAWLRRVTFDLTGLPPAPEQAAAFANDRRDDAYEHVVDDLLNSPHYGERQAQHWLDVVRYADTHGFEVNTERPHAWPYRDYVIRAFNDDVPYDRFLREQIAGDAAGADADAATGFLVTASVLLPGQIGADDASKRLARQDALDEIVVNIGQTFLGLSLGCARCHDHKFDPITQRDYYALQAFVAGVEYADRPLRTVAAQRAAQDEAAYRARLAEIDGRLAHFVPRAQSGARRPPINARLNTDRIAPTTARRVRFTIRATNGLEPCLDELEIFNTAGKNAALAAAGAKVVASGSTTVADRHELGYLIDGNYGNARSWMSNETGKGWVIVEFAQEETVERIVWGRDREGKFRDRLATDYRIEAADASGAWRVVADSGDRQKFDPNAEPTVRFSLEGLTAAEAAEARPLTAERAELETKIKNAADAQLVFAGTFRKPDDIRLLSRGDPEQPRERVVPAVPEALGGAQLDAQSTDAERRKLLADWIADPRNPLTARVMVNRVWQRHFGAGLVATPSDFGRAGLMPTHPELLDRLATDFLRDGWSVKRLQRRIVLSATYRQSSAARNDAAMTRDAEARLLWRFPLRRLDAESIRDAMLAVGGVLNPKRYGRGFDLFDKRGGLSGFNPVETPTSENRRRMIYAHKVRRERDAVFGAFDCPDGGQSTAVRRESTTPVQALNLFNSRFTLDAAQAFADRVRREAGADVAAQIRRAYALALCRDATREEREIAEPIVRRHGAETLCRALFNSNEFLFVP